MQWGNKVLPDNLKGQPHTDWPWPFRYVPRAWTVFSVPWVPKKFIGNQIERDILIHPDHPDIAFTVHSVDPVPKNNQWSIQSIKLASWLPYLPLFFTITKWNWHFRVGIRWDSVDGYMTPDIALTKQTPE